MNHIRIARLWALSALAVAGAVSAAQTQTGILTLTEDVTIDVPAGDRHEICVIASDTRFTLTKTGAGDLYVGRVASKRPRFAVQAGRLLVGPELTRPAVFAEATVFLTAERDDTLDTSVEDGRTYVNAWRDANGGTYSAQRSAYSNVARPYFATLPNGRRVLNFGTLRMSGTPEAYGAMLDFKTDLNGITGIREALLVQQYHPETAAAPSGSSTQGIGSFWNSVFTPFQKEAGKYPFYMNRWKEFSRQVRARGDDSGGAGAGGAVYVNGVALSSSGQSASGELEVINWRIVAPPEDLDTDYGRVNYLAQVGDSAARGGMVIGEVALFTRSFTDAERDQANGYLMAVWQGTGIPDPSAIVVGEGATAEVWNGTAYDKLVYHEPNVATPALDVSATPEVNVNAGVTNEVYALAGRGTLVKTGAGVLKIACATTTNVTLDVQAGEVVFGAPSAPDDIAGAAAWFDPANAATRTTATDAEGRTCLMRWTDANGEDIAAVSGDAAPYLSVEDGRTYLDFGSMKAANYGYLGYGGWMSLEPKLSAFREAIVVVRPNEELYAMTNAVIAPIGAKNWGAFRPGFNYKNAYPSIINNYQKDGWQIKNGIYVDGAKGSTEGDGQKWVTGTHVYTFRAEEPEAVGLSEEKVSCDRLGFYGIYGDVAGGFRMGDAVFFQRPLADKARARVEAYLKAKWQGASHVALASVTAAPGAKLTVLDGYSVTVGAAADDLSVDVRPGGRFTVDPLAVGTRVRFDAANTATRTEEVDEDGRTLVRCWTDANGGSAAATHKESAAPYLSVEDGRTYLDFGGVADGEAGVSGYGGWMQLDAEVKGFREAFLVLRPNEELVSMTTALIAPFGCDRWTGFLPGFNYKNAYPSIINNWQNYGNQIKNGIYVDGVQGKTTGDGQEWVAGVHVYNFRAAEPEDVGLDADGIAFNRIGSYNYHGGIAGGFRLGELIVYDAQLDAEARSRVEATLGAKWRGTAGAVQTLARLDVAPAATVALPHVNLAVTGELTLAGTLAAKSVCAAVLAPQTEDAAVSGALDLTTPGTVRLVRALYGEAFDRDFVRVIAAGSVAGTARGWTVELDTGRPVRLRARADGLYATGRMSGLAVIVR